jgi:hypothetical protein
LTNAVKLKTVDISFQKFRKYLLGQGLRRRRQELKRLTGDVYRTEERQTGTKYVPYRKQRLRKVGQGLRSCRQRLRKIRQGLKR